MDKPRGKTVLVFGVFDLLHPGHVAFLREAKRYGERLVVVVTRDERAEAEKGRRPHFSLDERIGMLAALSCVDEAVAGDAAGERTMIERLRPDVICVGHDQDTENPGAARQIAGLPVRPAVVRISATDRGRYSTTAICRRLGAGAKDESR